MENQDLDLLGQTVGNMFYKIGIVDKDGKVTKQFVANASTNRVDIPESVLGTSEVPQSQIPATTNLFSGSAVGNIVLSGPSATYDNIQDGLLLTLSNMTLDGHYHNFSGQSWIPNGYEKLRLNLSSVGLQGIKIPKEKLMFNSSFDISDQLSQYIGKTVKAQYATDEHNNWIDTREPPEPLEITSFEGTTTKALPNATISINIIVNINDIYQDQFQIPVIQVNDYKN